MVSLLYSAVFVDVVLPLAVHAAGARATTRCGPGSCFVPMTLSVALATSFAPRMVARFGVRGHAHRRNAARAAGLALLTGVRPGGSYLATCCLAACSPRRPRARARAGDDRRRAGRPSAQSGLASGLLNTSRLPGGALGLAALSTIAASHSRAQILGGASQLGALTSGYQLALAASAAVSLLGALAALVLLRTPSAQREAGVSASSAAR